MTGNHVAEGDKGDAQERRQVRECYTMHRYFNPTFISFCILMENDILLYCLLLENLLHES